VSNGDVLVSAAYGMFQVAAATPGSLADRIDIQIGPIPLAMSTVAANSGTAAPRDELDGSGGPGEKDLVEKDPDKVVKHIKNDTVKKTLVKNRENRDAVKNNVRNAVKNNIQTRSTRSITKSATSSTRSATDSRKTTKRRTPTRACLINRAARG
jgi:hypothetical protein